MELALSVTSEIPAPADALWDVLIDIANMTSFEGYGPIPGIASARWLEGAGAALGATRVVENRDGSTHRETVVAFEPPRVIEDRIFGFDSPVRFVVREIHDRFELEPAGESTILRRSLRFELTSPAALPVALVMRPLFRRAAERQHAELAERCAASLALKSV